MVQVQDTDFKFELVKPSIPQVTGRVSQDLMLTGHDVNTGKPNTLLRLTRVEANVDS